MMMKPWLKWLVMLTLSISFHLLVALSYFASANNTVEGGSAFGDGEDGIDIGLGQMGSYADMANQLLAADAPPKKTEEIKTQQPPPTKELMPVTEPIAEKLPTPIKPVKLVKEVIKKQPKAVVVKKPTTMAKSGDYQLKEKTSQPKKPPEVLEENENDQEQIDEAAAPIKEKKEQLVTSKASVKGTGVARDKSNGGFKGSNRNYFNHLSAWLNKFKGYPVEAKKLKQEGVVQVQFTIGPLGNVLAKSIKKSSGSQLLDQYALTVLTLADPLPEPPESLKRERLTLVIPINFSLITNN
ncbi:MAG: energy transducer TonB [Colwellia sp.]|nr:energy transducer TonB [Colwellia sp.]